LGNYNIEPPGLFRGRGEHPKTGCVKARTLAESISLNLSEDAPIPKCTLPGHAWNSVRHDPADTWLCFWTENVQNQTKYVMLSASSSFKGKSDQDKYLTAIQLKSCIGKVRRDYEEKIRSSVSDTQFQTGSILLLIHMLTQDRADKQLGTAMWVIDKLALRVGGEKGEEEADTYGCCSLLKEHLKFNPEPEKMEIELEFLGKDSMQYKQNIEFQRFGEVGELVFGCLRSFCAGKKLSDEVFETLTPPVLNKHLNSLMPGLTAKVFRTYNASVTLESELPSAESLHGLSVQEKVLQYNAANRQVAILCNHQKTVSKAAETMFEGLNEKLSVLNKQRDDMKE
jgi:DNA topoisomerase-1